MILGRRQEKDVRIKEQCIMDSIRIIKIFIKQNDIEEYERHK